MKNKISIILISLFSLISINNLLAKENISTDLIVEADNSIEFFEYYIASGNAVASKDGINLSANEIKAYLNDNNSEINYLIGKGKVSVTTKDISGKAEEVKYDFNNEIITFLKGRQSIQTKEILIESNKYLKFDNLKKFAEARGKVKLIFENKTTVLSNKLSALLGSKNNKLEKATAKEEVLVITNNSRIMGEKGVTNLNTGITKLLSGSGNKRVKGKFISKKK